MNDIGEKVFKMKYAKKFPSGNLEVWEQTVGRVATYVAQAETDKAKELESIAGFTMIMNEMSFIPGGRVLANAGTGIKNLMNCFVLPIEDSRQSIYETLKNAAEVFAWGGGVGYNFSNLRERGAPVLTTGGTASGPVSFMELFDTTGEVISQASRRGAQMGILNVDHPDIMNFINYKNIPTPKNQRLLNAFNHYLTLWKEQDELVDLLERVLTEDQLTHFNISVGIYDTFMNSAINDTTWNSIYMAKDILAEIARNAWTNGDPGLFFIDNVNETNLTPYLGNIYTTNPCGEVPLYPYEACCLGSLNLYNFVEGDFIDFDYLKTVIRWAVRFLDNVQTLNETPVEEINFTTKQTRRLGLGVMGFADILAEMGFEYDSEDAFALADVLGKFIQYSAWEASMELAEERGTFPAFRKSKVNWDVIDNLGLPRKAVRNIAVTSIAPTGTIALLAGVNSGIEPFFSKKYIRNITEGVGNEAKDSIEQDHNIATNITKTSHDIHWKDHIKMQAIWQKYVDNAVSKTINMSNDSTVNDVMDAFIYAWQMKCKGITIYRDKSRQFQILETKD